jgi:hypothetical protein
MAEAGMNLNEKVKKTEEPHCPINKAYFQQQSGTSLMEGKFPS